MKISKVSRSPTGLWASFIAREKNYFVYSQRDGGILPTEIINIIYLSCPAFALQVELLKYQAEYFWEQDVYCGPFQRSLLRLSSGLHNSLCLVGSFLGLFLFDSVALLGEITVRPVGDAMVFPRPHRRGTLVLRGQNLRGEIVI